MPPCSRSDLNAFALLQVEEVPGDFTQSDLATDDVMLLDTGDQVTLRTWIHAEERMAAVGCLSVRPAVLAAPSA